MTLLLNSVERFVKIRPVPGLVDRGSAHAVQLPHRIHEMNPSRNLSNRADYADLRARMGQATREGAMPSSLPRTSEAIP